MKINKRSRFLCVVIFFSLFVTAQTSNDAYLSYIEKYYKLAQKQQKEHRIPSSIILAQGLLESGAGESPLTKMSNNHFGIKCTDWVGDKFYYDDDAKGECFRKYDQVLDSYEDHAMFLKSRSRYNFLFEMDPTDYKGWAFGLKKAGYATDATYALKLISIIERFDLHRFDLGETFADVKNRKEKKSIKNPGKGDYSTSVGSIKAIVNHEVMKVNGARFVSSLSGDTYSSIADEFNMSEERLRKYNEVNSIARLNPDTRVFIAKKKNKARRKNKTHTVHIGESMYSISQYYAVKVEKLYKMNHMSYSEGAIPGKVLKLR